MDGWSVFARMLDGIKAFFGFEWRLYFAMRVLVVSRMGSQISKLQVGFELPIALATASAAAARNYG